MPCVCHAGLTSLLPFLHAAQVDGGVSTKNAGALLDAGANVLVAGGSVSTRATHSAPSMTFHDLP